MSLLFKGAICEIGQRSNAYYMGQDITTATTNCYSLQLMSANKLSINYSMTLTLPSLGALGVLVLFTIGLSPCEVQTG